eukprot:scaffold32909_cov152-Isochrysis_galbana.AAC.1
MSTVDRAYDSMAVMAEGARLPQWWPYSNNGAMGNGVSSTSVKHQHTHILHTPYDAKIQSMPKGRAGH